MTMEDEDALINDRAPRYEGEDTSPTSKDELFGWYAYALAAEVYAVCGVGSFLPVTIEQLARERGVLWSDRSVPCIPKPTKSVRHAALSWRALLRKAADAPQEDKNQCLVKPLGLEMTTASLSLYTFSAAVLIQALALVSFSGVADYGSLRKRFLLTFAFVGGTSCMLFLLVVPQIYLVGCLLVLVGVTCLGCSFTLLHSYLPILVANHPEASANNHRNGRKNTHEPEIRHGHAKGQRKDDPADLRLSTSISSNGIAIGYAAAVGVQILSIAILYTSGKMTSSRTLPLRIALFVTGLWWFVFSIVPLRYLRARPGPPPPHTDSTSRVVAISASVLFAWRSLYQTLRLAIQLKQVLRFLVAWFMLCDGISTISGTAILFARTELHMGVVPIAILSITATLSGLVGAFIWPQVARRWHLSSKTVILLCIGLLELIPLYGLLGFLAPFQRWGWGGLQRVPEIYPLAFVLGVAMGGLNSYCRAFFARLVPRGQEAAFFALYAVTDKGSSAVGPAVVGRIIDATGNARYGFWFVAVMVLLPLPVVWGVDVQRGKRDAEAVHAAGSTSVVYELDEVNAASSRRGSSRQEEEAAGLMRDHD